MAVFFLIVTKPVEYYVLPFWQYHQQLFGFLIRSLLLLEAKHLTVAMVMSVAFQICNGPQRWCNG